ncbi:GMC family oxidoreductase [Nocardioides sp. GCM10027113]|uniref:GMC family oxidoreductase n=1 Tax=unclassified Nocardioides TaxID=2615069 RepID=UPI003619B6DF
MSVVATTDVVIVGSGVAGALVADRLARHGVGVVVLEAGPPVDRDRAVEIFRQAPAKVPESPYPSTPHAPRPTVLDIGVPGTGYFVQEGPEPFGSTYERVVGGTTWHWLGSTPRLLPSDLEMLTRFGVGRDWPLSYDDLEPFYVEAERELGVAGDGTEDQGSPRSAGFPMPPIPLSFLDTVVDRAARRIGLRVLSTPQARNTETYNDRHRCVGNSNCIPICPIGAKYDAVIHLDRAAEHGARIIADAVVHEVLVRADGTARGVRFRRPDGTDDEVLGRAVVMAANAIETPKILLMSDGGRGIANRSGQVGQNLMDHPIALSYALSAPEEPVYPQRGPLSTAGIESPRQAATRGQRSAFRVEVGNDGWRFPIGDPTFEFTQGPFPALREGGAALAARWRDHVAHEIRFASLTEQLPDRANTVTPAFDLVDDIGIPRPRITFSIDAYTRAGLDEAQELHERLFTAMRARERTHVPFAFGAGHIMGTTIMGTSAADSVTDGFGRSHDVPNMWIVGSSVFPTAGTANPTLTLAALALRTAVALRAALPSLPAAGRSAATAGA